MAKPTKKGGAKKPSKKTKASGDPPRAGSAVLISATALKSLLRTGEAHAEQMSSINGTLRAEIKDAVEKKGLDPDAFAILKRFWRWTPDKAKRIRDTFLAYMDLSGLDKELDAQEELPIDDAEEKSEPEAKADNVVSMASAAAH